MQSRDDISLKDIFFPSAGISVVQLIHVPDDLSFDEFFNDFSYEKR
jgi:hypothetical protein